MPRGQTIALTVASVVVALPSLLSHGGGAPAAAWAVASAAAFWAGVGAHFSFRDARTTWLRVAWLGAFLELDISLRYRRGWALALGLLLLAIARVPALRRRPDGETWIALALAASPLLLPTATSPAFVALGAATLFAARSPHRGLRWLTPLIAGLATFAYTSAWPDAWLRSWRQGLASKTVAAMLLVAACVLAIAWPRLVRLRTAISPPVLASGVLYAVLALAWTHPLVFRLGDVIAHDAGDPLLNAWIIWWNAQAVPLTQAWWDAPMFHPAPGSFALSEHLLGLAPLTTPLQWLGASAPAAYNLALLVSIPLSAGAAHALCYRLTGRHDTALLGGLAFAFAPFRAAHLAHIQVLTTWTMPLCLLALHAYAETRAWAWLLLFGASWTLLGLTNGYYLLYLPVLLLMWAGWFCWRRLHSLLPVGLAAVAGLPLLLPVLWGYHVLHERSGLTRTSEDVRLGSAVLSSFVDASPLLLTSGWQERRFPSAEGWLFPGVTLVLLVAAGLVHARVRPDPARARLAFYAVAAVAMWWLCLGPEVRARPDGPALAPGPFALLMEVPGYARLRAPARFALLAALCLAVAGALAAARLLPRTRRGRTLAGALTAGVLAEGWIAALPLVPLPPRAPRLESLGSLATAVLELPLGGWEDETAAMHRATYHRLPLVNGFSGYTPPHYLALCAGLLAHDEDTLAALGESGAMAVLLDEARDTEGGWARFLASSPRVREWGRDGPWRLFLLAHQPAPPLRPGAPLAIARVRASLQDEDVMLMTDRDPTTRWTTDGPQSGQEVVDVELQGEADVKAVVLHIASSREDYPRRLVVETSRDGRAWTEAWQGTGYAPAVRAALADPRAVPVRFDFAVRPARHVRLRQTGRDPRMWWSIAEIEVLGPAPQAELAASARRD